MAARETTLDAISFEVLGRCVPKARARVGAHRAFTPERVKGWESSVGWACRLAMRDAEPFTGDIAVALTFTVGASQPGDLDNFCKSILDALNGVAYTDDSQVTRLSAELVRGDRLGVAVRITQTAPINRAAFG